MAGATNRAFKAAGIPKAAIKELRVTGGRGLTLRSAISLAEKHGVAVPQKAKDYLEKRDARVAAMKARRGPGPLAKRQQNLSASLRDVSRVALTNRKATAARSAAQPPVKGGRVAGNISTLRKLPSRAGLDVRATPAVLREYISPNLAGARTTANRKQRLDDMMSAMGQAVRNASYDAQKAGKPAPKSVTFSVKSLGEGGPQGTGTRQFNMKARLLGKGADGKPRVAVNLISMTAGGKAIKGGAERTARESRFEADVARKQGSGVTRDTGGAVRIVAKTRETVPFKHRGETVYAMRRPDGPGLSRVVTESGASVRNREAIKRGARVMRATVARANAGPSPAMQKAAAKRAATATADAAVARRAALVSAAGKRKNRVAPTVIMQSAKGVFGVEGSFTYKGQKYRARKTTTTGKTYISRDGGGLESRPVKGLQRRAERVINASLSRARGSQKDVTFRPRNQLEY